ncbi:WD40-repeat-containing domain protein [Amylocarpus encephaloides]|uniref:Elongator complex protein 2 n=1 Tax=Amylocarpus encephaloides TaxID=45428 RepID=A0A9P8C585_9HELO|nr:WD40-repeat-containing domain protein [Amylocarpus encephaloides]
MLQITTEYLATGANRHPSAADWDESGLLAFGADKNVALWRPQDPNSKGILELLSGHMDIVNAVKFIPGSGAALITGSVDKSLIIWKMYEKTSFYSNQQSLNAHDKNHHQSSINCIAISPDSKVFASGSADAIIKIWALNDQNVASFQQSIEIKPRFFPLAIALSPLHGAPGSYILAVSGTKDIIQLYVLNGGASKEFKLQATLAGHEGWIRSLEFTEETEDPNSDLILSSGSQDKYIRLWRIHQGKELPAAAASADPSLGAFMPGKSLSNKAHRFRAQAIDFSATFEALLLGHDDWIYSTKWRRDCKRLQLLSTSADNSLSMWESDAETGVWVTTVRLGEISSEKGSTTATGSTGGFWTGLWSPNGKTVVALGRTGSWRLWNWDDQKERWIQGIGVSGHTQSVTGIAWSKDGDYLLSTSSDQTTRLHAQWKREGKASWHEMARPQIHGYDLNCIDSLGASQFVSGADEKLMRVFNEPKAVAQLLAKLCGIKGSHVEEMPDAANMPVLGLSNKAIEAVEDGQEIPPSDVYDRSYNNVDPASIIHKSTLDLDQPTSEEHLSRHTLWPEIEKLYGHGYEISTLATSHDGTIIATACKASSIDHAVIRLFETATWLEIKPPLKQHSLTVARIRFSADDSHLLSVGRDRQWAVFARDSDDKTKYEPLEANPKGHTRMILDAAWAPRTSKVFATAGRDRKVNIWAKRHVETSFTCKSTLTETVPVTAIDFLDSMIGDGLAYLAAGSETGFVAVHSVDFKNNFKVQTLAVYLPSHYPNPTRQVTQLAWKPTHAENRDGEPDVSLAMASEDSSLRVYSYKPRSSVC